jgi:hypothetical protein
MRHDMAEESWLLSVTNSTQHALEEGPNSPYKLWLMSANTGRFQIKEHMYVCIQSIDWSTWSNILQQQDQHLREHIVTIFIRACSHITQNHFQTWLKTMANTMIKVYRKTLSTNIYNQCQQLPNTMITHHPKPLSIATRTSTWNALELEAQIKLESW